MAKKYSYWELRKIQYEQANFIQDTKFIEWLNTEYDNALNEINKEIFKYLSNIAEDNQISISDAKKLLNSNELKDFKMGLKLFTEKAQGNISKEVELALNNASHRFRISRLQAVETMIKSQIDNLLNIEQKEVFEHLGKKYLDTYYHMTHDLQSIKGYSHIQGINERKLNAILNRPWTEDNKNFSQRIWGRNDKIVNELQRQLTQSIIRGKDLKDITKDIALKFETSKRNATRLIYTESAAFTSMADEASYKETGLEKYKVLATLDNRTSETCREMDGKVFHLKDYKIFVTAPPFHIRCRSTTVPEFDDFLQDETRAMRNPNTGKSERIPYMNYDDWYKKHVVSNPEALLKEQMHKNKYQDKKTFQEYKRVLGKNSPRSFEAFRELKYNNSEDWRNLKLRYRKINAYDKVIKHEPDITKDLKDISIKTDVDLVGLDFRVKSKESYSRKVDSDSGNSKSIDIIDKTIGNMGDIIRYTYQGKPIKLVDSYFNIKKELEKSGYEFYKVKNYWLNKNNPYNGINCNLKSKQGQKFEVQFHTKESFDLKNGELHSLYEKWRIIENKASREAVEISKKMAELSNSLEIPKNIDKIR